MRIVKCGSVGVLLLVAIAVAIVARPSEQPAPEIADSTGASRQIESALSMSATNEALADSAPQQQVVNGWVARDLLQIQAEQLDSIGEQLETLSGRPAVRLSGRPAGQETDDRVPILLLVGIAMTGLSMLPAGSSIRSTARERPVSAPPVPPWPPAPPGG